MHYGEIKYFDIANGPGIRVSLFISGCPHACKGCFNEASWNPSFGELFTEEVEERILQALDKKEIQINGGILIKEYGYQPGPEMGEILAEIEYAIVDGDLENNLEAIHAYLREKK